MSDAQNLLSVRDLRVHFDIKSKGLFNAVLGRNIRKLKAVDGVSFDLAPGETLGVVGESGCGKSTLARAILNLIPATAGTVTWLGEDLLGSGAEAMRHFRRDLQIVFQDPLAALNPRMTVGNIVGEPLKVFYPKMPRAERREKVRAMLNRVGLTPEMVNRYPHEFSGGQCQRIGVARAMILEPKLIVCDEPVSALDVSIQAQIINLLMDLQREFGLSLIFISHDLSVVRHVSQRVMVLYLGRVMELADRGLLYAAPRHPYTRALLSAVPVPDPQKERNRERVVLEGDLPSPLDPPSGCVFRTRCPRAAERCANEVPGLEKVAPGHEVACFFADQPGA